MATTAAYAPKDPTWNNPYAPKGPVPPSSLPTSGGTLATTGMTGNNIPQPTINNQFPQSIMGANADYSGLMSQYQDLLGKADNPINMLAGQYQSLFNKPPSSFQPITPALVDYKKTADTTSSLANLKDLSATGGYSGADIANLRERAISPIRSVYSTAQQGIDRQKRLQGGYSPNYTAATAKLTRGLADSTANQMTNVNATIAQNVASNKLGIAPQYAGAAATEAAAGNRANEINSNAINQTNQFNSQGQTQAEQYDTSAKAGMLSSLQQLYNSGTGNKLEILNAMRALYGTTPAQPALYGSQAATQTGLDLQNKQINNSASGALINSYRN